MDKKSQSKRGKGKRGADKQANDQADKKVAQNSKATPPKEVVNVQATTSEAQQPIDWRSLDPKVLGDKWLTYDDVAKNIDKKEPAISGDAQATPVGAKNPEPAGNAQSAPPTEIKVKAPEVSLNAPTSAAPKTEPAKNADDKKAQSNGIKLPEVADKVQVQTDASKPEVSAAKSPATAAQAPPAVTVAAKSEEKPAGDKKSNGKAAEQQAPAAAVSIAAKVPEEDAKRVNSKITKSKNDKQPAVPNAADKKDANVAPQPNKPLDASVKQPQSVNEPKPEVLKPQIEEKPAHKVDSAIKDAANPKVEASVPEPVTAAAVKVDVQTAKPKENVESVVKPAEVAKPVDPAHINGEKDNAQTQKKPSITEKALESVEKVLPTLQLQANDTQPATIKLEPNTVLAAPVKSVTFDPNSKQDNENASKSAAVSEKYVSKGMQTGAQFIPQVVLVRSGGRVADDQFTQTKVNGIETTPGSDKNILITGGYTKSPTASKTMVDCQTEPDNKLFEDYVTALVNSRLDKLLNGSGGNDAALEKFKAMVDKQVEELLRKQKESEQKLKEALANSVQNEKQAQKLENQVGEALSQLRKISGRLKAEKVKLPNDELLKLLKQCQVECNSMLVNVGYTDATASDAGATPKSSTTQPSDAASALAADKRHRSTQTDLLRKQANDARSKKNASSQGAEGAEGKSEDDSLNFKSYARWTHIGEPITDEQESSNQDSKSTTSTVKSLNTGVYMERVVASKAHDAAAPPSSQLQMTANNNVSNETGDTPGERTQKENGGILINTVTSKNTNRLSTSQNLSLEATAEMVNFLNLAASFFDANNPVDISDENPDIGDWAAGWEHETSKSTADLEEIGIQTDQQKLEPGLDEVADLLRRYRKECLKMLAEMGAADNLCRDVAVQPDADWAKLTDDELRAILEKYKLESQRALMQMRLGDGSLKHAEVAPAFEWPNLTPEELLAALKKGLLDPSLLSQVRDVLMHQQTANGLFADGSTQCEKENDDFKGIDFREFIKANWHREEDPVKNKYELTENDGLHTINIEKLSATSAQFEHCLTANYVSPDVISLSGRVETLGRTENLPSSQKQERDDKGVLTKVQLERENASITTCQTIVGELSVENLRWFNQAAAYFDVDHLIDPACDPSLLEVEVK